MPGDHYILKGRVPVECSLMEWARWKQENPDACRVAWDSQNGVNVSTVFLGLNHAFTNGPPLIFETMVFGGIHDQDMDRYSTYTQAEAGHREMCEKVFGWANVLEAEYIEI